MPSPYSRIVSREMAMLSRKELRVIRQRRRRRKSSFGGGLYYEVERRVHVSPWLQGASKELRVIRMEKFG